MDNFLTELMRWMNFWKLGYYHFCLRDTDGKTWKRRPDLIKLAFISNLAISSQDSWKV